MPLPLGPPPARIVELAQKNATAIGLEAKFQVVIGATGQLVWALHVVTRRGTAIIVPDGQGWTAWENAVKAGGLWIE